MEGASQATAAPEDSSAAAVQAVLSGAVAKVTGILKVQPMGALACGMSVLSSVLLHSSCHSPCNTSCKALTECQHGHRKCTTALASCRHQTGVQGLDLCQRLTCDTVSTLLSIS